MSTKCNCVAKLKETIERLVSVHNFNEMDTSFEEKIYEGGFHDAMDLVDIAIKQVISDSRD